MGTEAEWQGYFFSSAWWHAWLASSQHHQQSLCQRLRLRHGSPSARRPPAGCYLTRRQASPRHMGPWRATPSLWWWAPSPPLRRRPRSASLGLQRPLLPSSTTPTSRAAPRSTPPARLPSPCSLRGRLRPPRLPSPSSLPCSCLTSIRAVCCATTPIPVHSLMCSCSHAVVGLMGPGALPSALTTTSMLPASAPPASLCTMVPLVPSSRSSALSRDSPVPWSSTTGTCTWSAPTAIRSTVTMVTLALLVGFTSRVVALTIHGA